MREKSVDILPVISRLVRCINVSICYLWCINRANSSHTPYLEMAVKCCAVSETFFHSCFTSELRLVDDMSSQSKS